MSKIRLWVINWRASQSRNTAWVPFDKMLEWRLTARNPALGDAGCAVIVVGAVEKNSLCASVIGKRQGSSRSRVKPPLTWWWIEVG